MLMIFVALFAWVVLFPDTVGEIAYRTISQETGDMVVWTILIFISLLILVVCMAICRNLFKNPPRVERLNLSRHELGKIRANLLKTNTWKKR